MMKNCMNCKLTSEDSFNSLCGTCEKHSNWTPIGGFEIKNDNINKPAHYTQGKIETIDYLESCLTHEEFKGFLKGNIIKYTSRERLKGGVEDIKKGEYYKKKLITLMETGK